MRYSSVNRTCERYRRKTAGRIHECDSVVSYTWDRLHLSFRVSAVRNNHCRIFCTVNIEHDLLACKSGGVQKNNASLHDTSGQATCLEKVQTIAGHRFRVKYDPGTSHCPARAGI